MTSRAKLALALMALLTVLALVYAPVSRGVYVADDHALVETSWLVRQASVREIFALPWSPDARPDARPVYYRPLSALSLRADFGMSGDEPSGFHVTNLLLHLIATLALALVARRLGAGPRASCLAATVWALHPRSTEAVAWIAGRTDLLAGVMALAAVGLWPWFGHAGADADADADADASAKARGRGRRWEWARAGMAAGAVGLGLMAKEVAAAAVVAIAVGTWAGAARSPQQPGSPTWEWRRGDWRRRAAYVAPRLSVLAVAIAGYAALRWRATGGLSSGMPPLGVETRALTVLEAVGRYALMVADPWHPSSVTGVVGEVDRARAVLGAFVLVASAALAAFLVVRQRRRAKAAGEDGATEDGAPERRVAAGAPVAVASALGLAALAVVTHVAPIAVGGGVAGDRLLYLPLAGLVLAAAVASPRLARRTQTVIGIAALALAASFVPFTRGRLIDYTDELRFRLVAAENANPQDTIRHSVLANALRAAGELDLACRMHASTARLLENSGRAGSIRHTRALENLGGCYAMLGDYERAEQTFAALLTRHPNGARIHMEVGYLRLHQLAVDDAERAFRRALELDPSIEAAKGSLAVLPHLRAELAALATPEARSADRVRWARLLTGLGRVPEAAKAWVDALEDESTTESAAWDGMVIILATADLPNARRAVAQYVSRWTFGARAATARLDHRTAEHARIDAMRPRLEALALTR